MVLVSLAGGCLANVQGGGAPTPSWVASTEGWDASLQKVVQDFLNGWKAKDYKAMYALLTQISQDAIDFEEFERTFQGVEEQIVLSGVDYNIRSVLVNEDTAQVRYQVVLHSVLVNDIARETVMYLRREGNRWRVQWDEGLILPELHGGNTLWMERRGYVPMRANIYDRYGNPLVAQTDAVAVGLHPDEVDPDQKEALFEQLASLLGMRVEAIRAYYESAPPGAGWYVPLGEVSAERAIASYEALSKFSGVVLSAYKSRYYYEGGIAPHVTGYVSSIQPEEVEYYTRLGYQQDERVGRSGLERWGEAYLTGKRGGALYVVNPQGQLITLLAEVSPEPPMAIYTTIERDFQLAAQQAISGFRGAIVVIEMHTGRVLAMVSSPGFNPNAFEPININSTNMLEEIFSNPYLPLLNRATQGQYPIGSVFKIVTMSAALKSGLYSAESSYQCGYFFEEIEGLRLNDWTYDYFLHDGRTMPSGLLTLPQGLIRSCNPFFWHIGLDFYNRGMTTAIADMARAFGLGSASGIVGLDEASGRVPEPVNAIDAVNLAIGQGEFLATPLQVANMVASIGNGGTLYRPQVIERVVPPRGEPVIEFKPEVIGTIPLNPENLRIIQEAMVGVIRSESPRGTAWHRFTGLDIPVAGKTGTATSGSGLPHAWFAGYTFAAQPDRPDIAIAVVVENIGEGSDYAAPIFRRIVELYFSGQPQKLYWWEAAYNVTLTPTPAPVTLTPSPSATQTSSP